MTVTKESEALRIPRRDNVNEEAERIAHELLEMCKPIADKQLRLKESEAEVTALLNQILVRLEEIKALNPEVEREKAEVLKKLNRMLP